MEIKSLKYFIEVVNTMNFTRAAKSCGVSQATVSQAIARMEKEMGAVLLKRTNRSVHLTQAGYHYYKWAKATWQSYEKLIKQFEEIQRGEFGVLKMGMTNSYDGLYMRKLLKERCQHIKDIQIEMHIMKMTEMMQALHNREIDTFFSPPFDYADRKDLLIEPVETFPMVLVLSNEHLLAQEYETQIPKSRLEDYNCLVLKYANQPKASQQFTGMLGAEQITFKKIVQTEYMEEIFLNLPGSDMVSFLPSFEKDYIDQNLLTWRTVEDCTMKLPFALCSGKNIDNAVFNSVVYGLRHNMAEK